MIPDATRAALERTAAAPRLFVGLDFDGVLAGFQLDPMTSEPRPESVRAYRRLGEAGNIVLAFISGRDIDDLRVRVQPPAGALFAGSHGAQIDASAIGAARARKEPADDSTTPSELERRHLASLDADLAALSEELASYGTFRIEPKPLGRTVHTRGLDDDFATTLTEGCFRVHRAHPEFRYTSGHGVLEFAVRHRTKGDALSELRAASTPDAVIYIGDDTTDEDAFERLDPGRTRWPDLGIKVGGGETLATGRVAGLTEVTEVLELLVALRGA